VVSPTSRKGREKWGTQLCSALGLYAALKRRSSTVVPCGGCGPLSSTSKARSTPRSKATDRSVRSTRATPTPRAPGFARWTAEGGCPHICFGGLNPIPFLCGFAARLDVVSFPGLPVARFVARFATSTAGLLVETPCQADDGVQGVGILRLRMTSTSWASCFAQDDKSRVTDRSVRSTRATPTPTAPGFARWTAEGGCPHICFVLKSGPFSFTFKAACVRLRWGNVPPGAFTQRQSDT